MSDRSPVNEFLNNRMSERMQNSGRRLGSPRMQQYVFGRDAGQSDTGSMDRYHVIGRPDLAEVGGARTSYRELNEEGGGQPMGRPQGGTDMDMMRMYGPEDQVAYDRTGRPIPLADPSHPRNARPPGMMNTIDPRELGRMMRQR